jgi:hypothetical protein
LADVTTMLWHCTVRGPFGAAQSFTPADWPGDGATAKCGIVGGGVAAAAGPALASPGNVIAAAARHAPTVAYNLKRKVNSPERVIREAVESSDTRGQPKNSRTRTETQKEG